MTHPNVQSLIRYFNYEHLPPKQAAIAEKFRDIALDMADKLSGPELTAGLRKLLESKDCMVRASLDLADD